MAIKRILWLVGVVSLLTSSAGAQTFGEYLKSRKQYHITQAVGIEALETMMGSRIVEVQGRVKGSMTGVDGAVLLLERTDGSPMFVRCATVPDWLDRNETPARLLVRASKPTETSALRADLIAAAPEYRMAAIDALTAKAIPRSIKPRLPVRPPVKSAKAWYLPASEVTPYYASYIRARNKRLTDDEALRIAQGIVGFSLRYGVDARLIMAMVMVESGFNPRATSRAGAMGLGQLMPGTARGMGVSNAYDSIDNLNGTVRLVRGHLEKYKRQTGRDFDALVLALAAYNAGGGAVKRFNGVPAYRETQNYVRKVIAWYYAFCGVR